jgi:aspartate/methionine/tyrosine aminotransferase
MSGGKNAPLKSLNPQFHELMRIDFAEFDIHAGEAGAMMDWADPFRSCPRVPLHVIEATKAALDRGTTCYSLPIGSLALRRVVAARLHDVNGITADPSTEIIVTPGSDAGLHHAIRAVLVPGDEVIVPEPSYPSNFGNTTIAGGTVVPMRLSANNGYQIEIEQLRELVTTRSKLIILTQPNNPTGTIYNGSSLDAVREVAQSNGLYVIADQAFEANVFDGRKVMSIASLPGMWDRTITLFSTSKAMGLSGFRIGYTVACRKLMQVLHNSAVLVLGAPNSFAQEGALAGLRNDRFIGEFNAVYDRRRRLLHEALNAIPGVRMALPEAGFMAWVDVSILGSSRDVADYIRKSAGISVSDGRMYGPSGDGFLRIVYGAVGSDAHFEESVTSLAFVLRRFAATPRSV